MTPNSTEIVEAIRRERANAEWINGSIKKLRHEYGGRYIAVRDRKVLDADGDFDALLTRVRELPNPESVTIEHISEMEYIWLL